MPTSHDAYKILNDTEHRPIHSKVVGVTHANPNRTSRQRILREKAATGVLLTLTREPDNQYNPNTIAVYIGTDQIGYLSSELANELAHEIDSGRILYGVVTEVTGGGDLNLGCNILLSWDEIKVENSPASNPKTAGCLGSVMAIIMLLFAACSAPAAIAPTPTPTPIPTQAATQTPESTPTIQPTPNLSDLGITIDDFTTGLDQFYEDKPSKIKDIIDDPRIKDQECYFFMSKVQSGGPLTYCLALLSSDTQAISLQSTIYGMTSKTSQKVDLPDTSKIPVPDNTWILATDQTITVAASHNKIFIIFIMNRPAGSTLKPIDEAIIPLILMAQQDAKLEDAGY